MKQTHIIHRYGTTSFADGTEVAVTLPAVPGVVLCRDARPETAPRRGVLTPRGESVADRFVAALREARDAARREAQT